jgi:hypothetical protein
MDVNKILTELREEREQGRRGRAPVWLRRGSTTKLPGPPRGGGGGGGPATPTYPRPRLEDIPTRRRGPVGNSDLKG